MEIACPGCQLSIDVRQSATGMRLLCPGCGENFRIPADPELVDPPEVWLADDEDPPPHVSKSQKPVRLAGARRTKTCPMCGEKEEADARRCRSCGEVLAGFQGADGYSLEGVWRDGNRLVMTKHAHLPALCVQTNQPTSERLRRRLYWHSPWLYLLIFAGLLVYAIVALIVRQSADIRIGLCRERIVRRRWIIAGAWLGAFAGIAVCAAGGQLGIDFKPIAWIAGLMLMFGSLIAGLIMSRVIAPTRITSRYVWIKGVNPAYLAALPPFPGER